MVARWHRLPMWAQALAIIALVAVGIASLILIQIVNAVREPSAVLREDTITNADMWDTEPRMMAAGLGFTNIIGVPGIDVDTPARSASRIHRAGGAWNTVECAPGVEPDQAAFTSAATPEQIATTYGAEVFHADGLPIEFSWPVLPSSVSPDDFLITLSDGSTTAPEVAAVWPNFEFNERSTVVIFGYFGNRIDPREDGAIYPTYVEVVESDTPLQLVGNDAEVVSAVGMGVAAPGSPYTDPDVAPDERGGPRLAAAKLTRYSSQGDTGPRIFRSGLLPNHGEALYGDAAQYRLRVFTTGGMTPDGVRGMWPTEYERFFRVIAVDDTGTEVLITEAGVDYEINGGTLRVEGLADLGLKQDVYDDCYQEDKDNQIDIILSGDDDALRAITRVQMPSTGDYSPVYNPGGPGNDPAPGVRYAAPSPPIDIDVLMALDDPLVANYP